MNTSSNTSMFRKTLAALAVLAVGLPFTNAAPAHAVATSGRIVGEIERITLNADGVAGDIYAGGQMVVGGQNVIIPRNLLIDLPANRLTLQQLFAQAPAACLKTGETGLAKADRCNLTGTGSIATLAANRVSTGDVIVGDALIEKGLEDVDGTVTYVNYHEGWFMMNGRPGDSTTGTMVRLNDPTARHTVQSGKGCAISSRNCSADPRFALDIDNYTNIFSTGYPLCIPSTTVRQASATLPEFALPTPSDATGAGDTFCPTTNRLDSAGAPLRVAADSRRMAPLLLGDSILVDGNYESVGGVRFLSAHSSQISYGLQTSAVADQPDYMHLTEAFIDMPGFQLQRARSLFIGATTEAVADVLGWSVHYDPAANKSHELPLASSKGCEAAGRALSCAGVVAGTFVIRYDSDFAKRATANLSPCAQLNHEVLFAPVCPTTYSQADEFAVLSPIPHEIHFKTRKKATESSLAPLLSIDINGAQSTNGQYLNPLGISLGGMALPDALELNLDTFNMPYSFEGVPWNLDRRLSPGGCTATGCEATPQPLSPFPYSDSDPRMLAAIAAAAAAATGGVPTGPIGTSVYSNAPLSSAADRILSFIPNGDATTFAGDSSLLDLPTASAVSQGITPTPALDQTAPALLGFDPIGGLAGSSVHVGGLGLDKATTVTIGGVDAMFQVISATRLEVQVPKLAPEGGRDIVITIAHSTSINSVASDVVVSSGTPFNVLHNPLTPTVSSLDVSSGQVGQAVTITGTHLTAATDVLFGSISASASFVVVDDSTITVNVPGGSLEGTVDVKVLTPNGDVAAPSQFTVTVPAPTTTIADAVAIPLADVTSILPESGEVGTLVTITGTGFLGATQVSFNGAIVAATVVDDTTITATVPVHATSGYVTILSPNGTGTGAGFVVVIPAPVAKAVSPIAANQSSVVTLDASASSNATTFAWTQLTGTPVVLTGADTARPTFTMPAQFKDLSFRVTVSNRGTVTSTADVTVTASAGSVTITAGTEFRTTKNQWTAAGTASFPLANTITVRTGNVPGAGTLIGTAVVDALGAWTFTAKGSTVPQNANINVVASRGGSTASSVLIRR